ncbi:hypothetical protein M3J09_007075 [Ascochyta lentis]
MVCDVGSERHGGAQDEIGGCCLGELNALVAFFTSADEIEELRQACIAHLRSKRSWKNSRLPQPRFIKVIKRCACKVWELALQGCMDEGNRKEIARVSSAKAVG